MWLLMNFRLYLLSYSSNALDAQMTATPNWAEFVAEIVVIQFVFGQAGQIIWSRRHASPFRSR